MNLNVSYDWLKEYVSLKETPEAFAERVSLSGPGVEHIMLQGEDLHGIVVGHVKTVEKHPNADALRVALVDVGGKKPAHIVCGGKNLEEGQWVVVAQPGSKVRWHGEGELVELQPTEIRGIKSDGMICAANEIGLFDAFPHAEREILDLGKSLDGKLRAGSPLADVLGLSGNVVMDIEVTSNRPDAMSMVGIAREASAILGRPLTWKAAPTIRASGKKQTLTVKVNDKKLCPRYQAVRIDNVTIGRSPWWLARRLLAAGLRPINTAVDITNYVMLELGQPLHAFDASRTNGAIHVRLAKVGEKLKALNGETYALTDRMLIIADAERPLAIAGVMGGEESGVSAGTTSIILEAATFDPVSIRKTARALNLMSDAQLRFEKGLSTEAPPFALARAVELMLELCGGQVATSVTDVKAGAYKAKSFTITFEEITSLIGVDLPTQKIKTALTSLGFNLKTNSKKLTATVPWWRDKDISSPRDLVEEVARVIGYANLPAIFPAGKPTHQTDPNIRWEERARDIAVTSGLTETFTYSFVSRELLERAGYDPAPMLRVQNELTNEFEFMRTSLLPSLLNVVRENIDRFPEQALFELANVYYPKHKSWKDLPNEQMELGVAFVGAETAWRKAKGFAETLLSQLGVQGVTWRALTNDPFWHPGRSAQAWQGELLLGTVGELHPSIAARFSDHRRIALVDLPLQTFLSQASNALRYTAVPLFPDAKRDLALVVRRETAVADLLKAMRTASPLLVHVEWFDTYRGKEVRDDKKSVAFHLTFQHVDRTLETAEVDKEMSSIETHLKKAFDAQVRA
jgi:phenylalanyl-tRNA synthetase beta chain